MLFPLFTGVIRLRSIRFELHSHRPRLYRRPFDMVRGSGHVSPSLSTTSSGCEAGASRIASTSSRCRAAAARSPRPTYHTTRLARPEQHHVALRQRLFPTRGPVRNSVRVQQQSNTRHCRSAGARTPGGAGQPSYILRKGLRKPGRKPPEGVDVLLIRCNNH